MIQGYIKDPRLFLVYEGQPIYAFYISVFKLTSSDFARIPMSSSVLSYNLIGILTHDLGQFLPQPLYQGSVVC